MAIWLVCKPLVICIKASLKSNGISSTWRARIEANHVALDPLQRKNICTRDKIVTHFINKVPNTDQTPIKVASSLSCSRRTIFDDRLKISENSIAALIGTLLHQIFQEGLNKRLPSRHYLEEHAKQVLLKNLESLYACGANEKDVLSSLLEVIPRMLTWFTSFMKESDKSTVDFGQFEKQKVVRVNEVCI
ncbi:DNA replication ATP-dependent helicase/nuclease JHS1-like [Carex rostrata]